MHSEALQILPPSCLSCAPLLVIESDKTEESPHYSWTGVGTMKLKIYSVCTNKGISTGIWKLDLWKHTFFSVRTHSAACAVRELLAGSALSFHHLDLEDQTQVISHGGKFFRLWSHLVGFTLGFFLLIQNAYARCDQNNHTQCLITNPEVQKSVAFYGKDTRKQKPKYFCLLEILLDNKPILLLRRRIETPKRWRRERQEKGAE